MRSLVVIIPLALVVQTCGKVSNLVHGRCDVTGKFGLHELGNALNSARAIASLGHKHHALADRAKWDCCLRRPIGLDGTALPKRHVEVPAVPVDETKAPFRRLSSLAKRPFEDCDIDYEDVDEPLAPVTTIEEANMRIMAELKRRPLVTLSGMDPSLHYLPPHFDRRLWHRLGAFIKARESSTGDRVDPRKWLSLRLDGASTKSVIKFLRRHGILESNCYSQTFAEAMQAASRVLMKYYDAVIGYTHSDEIIILIPPPIGKVPFKKGGTGNRFEHHANGRVFKMTTHASSIVAAMLSVELSRNCANKKICIDRLAEKLVHFDCRVAQYDSWEEARGALLWRAWSLSEDGITEAVRDAIMGNGNNERKGNLELNLRDAHDLDTLAKTEWLWKEGLLPLNRRQAYGSLLVKVARRHGGYNPILRTNTTTMRYRFELNDAPVLGLMRNDSLFLEDDPPLEKVTSPRLAGRKKLHLRTFRNRR